MDISIKEGVLYVNSIENSTNIKHSYKRLRMLSLLTTTSGIALQQDDDITVLLRDGTICSTPAKDSSFKIYPVIVGVDPQKEQLEATIAKIYEYCVYKINFLKEYSMPIFSKPVENTFNKLVREACQTPTRNKLKRILLITELHLLKKHTQDIIVSKTIPKEVAEAKFLELINTY